MRIFRGTFDLIQGQSQPRDIILELIYLAVAVVNVLFVKQYAVVTYARCDRAKVWYALAATMCLIALALPWCSLTISQTVVSHLNY